MDKRGQIALFIILAVVIILVIGITVFLITRNKTESVIGGQKNLADKECVVLMLNSSLYNGINYAFCNNCEMLRYENESYNLVSSDSSEIKNMINNYVKDYFMKKIESCNEKPEEKITGLNVDFSVDREGVIIKISKENKKQTISMRINPEVRRFILVYPELINAFKTNIPIYDFLEKDVKINIFESETYNLIKIVYINKFY